jgi:FAD/FMN-containing dehydrogenase/Fe-S oxidoreductase
VADIQEFATALQSRLCGEVLADVVSRGIYASDASHYQIMPSCVAIPRHAQDVITAVQLASERGIPVTPRGGGTSLSGQTTWTGLVLDVSKYMNRILEINPGERWVRVEPGVVRDDLNKQLASYGLQFAPDPATGNRANIGGMIGNNSSGTRSVIYGKTSDHVLACSIVLADGTTLSLQSIDSAQWRQQVAESDRVASIYQGVRRIVEANRDEIARRFPKVMRRVSGYNLDAFLPPEQGGPPGPWNLARLFVGSEGSLGVLLEAKLRLEPLPKHTALCIVHFHDVIESLRAVVPLLTHQPSAIELLDHHVLGEAQRNRTTAALADFLIGTPRAVQIVELFGESPVEAKQRAESLARDMQARQIGYAWPVRTEPAGIQRVWDVRKLGLGLVSNLPGRQKGIEFVEDTCVSVDVLPEYISKLVAICQRHGVEVVLYAHASVGVLHARPMLDLHDPADIQLMRRIAEEVFELVVSYGGSFASEHGDGLLRGEFIPRFYGPRIFQAFREIKQLFDPSGIMNPGKIIDAEPMTSHLRYDGDYRPSPPPSGFQYRDQGGFVLAVEQCNGVGACRKTAAGTMCPSYMATRDEEHSTRGRANALRMAMAGQLGKDALTSDRVLEVLDLCLSCKACKAECPNAVDMSRLKADVLQWRYRKSGTPFGARFIAQLPGMLPPATRVAGLVNWIQRRPLFHKWLHRMTGIDPRRPLPPVAGESLVRWFRRQPRTVQPSANGLTVALFCDTFTNYLEPDVGRAAIQLLQGCGYHVRLADVGCCQRPAISKGMLDRARRHGAATVGRLTESLRDGGVAAVLVLEPSCASALTDDLPDLLPVEMTDALVPKIKMVDVFLAEQYALGRLNVPLKSPYSRLLIHGHCHQKALYGTAAMRSVLARVPDLEFSEIDSGCCGMAGSFGYDHYDLSAKIGEDRLFPAVRNRHPGTEIVACGISCRHQLRDMLGVHAHHWVEVLRAVP